jgi:hypothetical protein
MFRSDFAGVSVMGCASSDFSANPPVVGSKTILIERLQHALSDGPIGGYEAASDGPAST